MNSHLCAPLWPCWLPSPSPFAPCLFVIVIAAFPLPCPHTSLPHCPATCYYTTTFPCLPTTMHYPSVPVLLHRFRVRAFPPPRFVVFAGFALLLVCTGLRALRYCCVRFPATVLRARTRWFHARASCRVAALRMAAHAAFMRWLRCAAFRAFFLPAFAAALRSPNAHAPFFHRARTCCFTISATSLRAPFACFWFIAFAFPRFRFCAAAARACLLPLPATPRCRYAALPRFCSGAARLLLRARTARRCACAPCLHAGAA